MKVIHYGSDELTTGDLIADALVHYAEFLAVANLADTVNIPVFDSHGGVVLAKVLLGPSSQIVALPVETDADEIVDDAVIADLMAKADKIGPAKAYPTASPEDSSTARFADEL